MQSKWWKKTTKFLPCIKPLSRTKMIMHVYLGNWGEWSSGLSRERIGRIQVETQLDAWPSLGTQPRCDAPGGIRIDNIDAHD